MSCKVNFLTFNQTKECFAYINDEGFNVYKCNPLTKSVSRQFNKGTLKSLEMMYKSNIFILIGNGTNPIYPLSKAIIWDDHQSKPIGELAFRSDIKNVKLKRDRIIIVLEHKCYIYNFSDLSLIDSIETFNNPDGFCTVAEGNNNFATLATQVGSIRVELYDEKKTTIIDAHQSKIGYICFNNDSSLIATSSETGTIIRVFNTSSGKLVKEFRRGIEMCKIYNIAFNCNSTYFAVTSSRGTCHIFSLTEHQKNTTSSLSFMSNLLPDYFNSNWSFAKFILPDTESNIISFISSTNDLMIISLSGNIYNYKYYPKNDNGTINIEYKLDTTETY